MGKIYCEIKEHFLDMKATIIIPTNCSVVDSQKVGPVAAPQLINWSSWKVKNKKSESVYLKSMSHCPPNQAIEQSSWKVAGVEVRQSDRPCQQFNKLSPAPPLPPNYTTEVSDLNWIYKVGLISSSISPDCHVQLSKWSSWYLELKNVACLLWDCAHCLLNSYAR